jgi:hypothetical protein
LQSTGISPFIWSFNPVNQSYEVTDDPEYEITAGTGFFVRVNPGTASGTLTFNAPSAEQSQLAGLSKQAVENTIFVTLSKEGISEQYKLVLDANASDSLSAEDAEKIGIGIVNISGIDPELKKMAIDRRSLSGQSKSIRLSVQGQLAGRYLLEFRGLENFRAAARITLEDKYLSQRLPISGSNQSYAFDIDKSLPVTEGDNRFVLHIDGAKLPEDNSSSIKVYPNPFTDVFHVRSSTLLPDKLCIRIRDVMGNLVLSREWNFSGKAGTMSLSAASLNKGVYFLELADCKTNVCLKYAKLIKQ